MSLYRLIEKTVWHRKSQRDCIHHIYMLYIDAFTVNVFKAYFIAEISYTIYKIKETKNII